MPRRSLPLLLLCLATLLVTSTAHAEPDRHVGVLVMAHGGSDEWNASVRTAVSALSGSRPVELAFGMADRESLRRGIDALASAGARRVVVLRLFISGDSFLEQTQYLLGLREVAPSHLVDSGATPPGVAVEPVRHTLDIAISAEGLAESATIGEVLARRTASLSRSPENEDVVLIAHGMGDDEADRRLRESLRHRADQVQRDAPYRTVRVETLREDWSGKREEAERRIRAAVAEAPAGQTLVVPVRLHGFGPYASVLAGIEYRADERGLLPSPLVVEWMREQVTATACAAGWLTETECASAP